MNMMSTSQSMSTRSNRNISNIFLLERKKKLFFFKKKTKKITDVSNWDVSINKLEYWSCVIFKANGSVVVATSPSTLAKWVVVDGSRRAVDDDVGVVDEIVFCRLFSLFGCVFSIVWLEMREKKLWKLNWFWNWKRTHLNYWYDRHSKLAPK